MGKNGTVSILVRKFNIGKKRSIQEWNCATSFHTWEFDFSFGTVYPRICWTCGSEVYSPNFFYTTAQKALTVCSLDCRFYLMAECWCRLYCRKLMAERHKKMEAAAARGKSSKWGRSFKCSTGELKWVHIFTCLVVDFNFLKAWSGWNQQPPTNPPN
jgi:hypothetical protein